MPYIARTLHLTKAFQGKEVVSNVNMNIEQGSIYGFLGPNGAGKTTVMRMLTNLVKPTSGEIELFGEKLTNHSYEFLGKIGALIEYPVFYEKLTAQENLELHCEYMGFHHKNAISEALELVKLRNIEQKSVRDFSLGMKQRLGIARAMITKPQLLILDEPINGLDPIGIKEIRELFRMLSQEYGITLLISTHILGEIEQIADTIGVINHGRMIQEVSMEQVRSQNTAYIEIELSAEDCSKTALILEDALKITNFRVFDQKIIRIYEPIQSQSQLTTALVTHGIEIHSIQKKNNTLEEYFLELLHGGVTNVKAH